MKPWEGGCVRARVCGSIRMPVGGVCVGHRVTTTPTIRESGERQREFQDAQFERYCSGRKLLCRCTRV